MKKQKQVLLQTMVPAELAKHARLCAKAECISVAAWLRRLVLNHFKFQKL